MNELRDWLEEGDPVGNEPPLSGAEAQRMRRAILAEGASPESSFADWVRGSWAGATVVVALTIAVGMSQWLRPREGAFGAPATVDAPVEAPEGVSRRQVQLIAPGGTRVIWIFNADFKQ